MEENGKDYADILKDAQAKGFAEADPTADVEGIDAANKLSILISLVFGLGVAPDQIPTQGITHVGADDIAFAKDSGYKIKLLASAREENGEVCASVEPTLVPVSHPLANVRNEFNAVFITGNAVDNLMFYGRGAGPLPTGSAVMGDVIGVARKWEKDSAYDIVPQLRYDADLKFIGEGSNKYYVRMTAEDIPGVMGKITTILGAHGISIETALQRPGKNFGDAPSSAAPIVPLIFIFANVEKTIVSDALDDLLANHCVKSIETVMRVEE